MEDLIKILIAVIASTGFWNFLNLILSRKREQKSGIAQMTLALGRDKIRDLAEKHLTDGYITEDDFEVIEKLVKAYFQLGGNGLVVKLWEQVQRLPIKTFTDR